ncbi:MAG: class E sortase [Oscillospiraceae bacterium]|nr:class E sortase [Oscillospiraceae bacterium]
MSRQTPAEKQPVFRRAARWLKGLSATRKLSLLLTAAGICLIAYYVCVNYLPKLLRELSINENLDIVSVDAMDLVPISEQTDEIYAHYVYPENSMFVTAQRKAFSDGDLYLSVPRLGYEGPVLDGTSENVLKRGPGLYQYSPLPSYGNPNVSIAGHRGVYGAEFYKIDTFEPGDAIILWYDGYVFVYEYRSTQVVTLTDWTPIYCSDENTVTLTTCDMNNNTDRWVVTGVLVSVRRAQPEGPCYKEVSDYGKAG